MRRFICVLSVFCAIFMAMSAWADSYRTYDPAWAVDYASTNYNTSYGSGSSQNPFSDYSGASGGNCTNFVSQAIMAGFVDTDSMSTTYAQRSNYDIDKGSGSYYQWYFISNTDRGPAFTGANKLYEYAVHNWPTYRGLHFEYVTHDTTTAFMDYTLVEEGDIIFADWEHDGVIDHSMIVTDYQWWQFGHNEIRLTYQGTPGVVGKTNIGLGDINEDYDYEAVFYVYRPVDYSPTGY